MNATILLITRCRFATHYLSFCTIHGLFCKCCKKKIMRPVRLGRCRARENTGRRCWTRCIPHSKTQNPATDSIHSNQQTYTNTHKHTNTQTQGLPPDRSPSRHRLPMTTNHLPTIARTDTSTLWWRAKGPRKEGSTNGRKPCQAKAWHPPRLAKGHTADQKKPITKEHKDEGRPLRPQYHKNEHTKNKQTLISTRETTQQWLCTGRRISFHERRPRTTQRKTEHRQQTRLDRRRGGYFKGHSN